mgnify:CR=1 FL=1
MDKVGYLKMDVTIMIAFSEELERRTRDKELIKNQRTDRRGFVYANFSIFTLIIHFDDYKMRI